MNRFLKYAMISIAASLLPVLVGSEIYYRTHFPFSYVPGRTGIDGLELYVLLCFFFFTVCLAAEFVFLCIKCAMSCFRRKNFGEMRDCLYRNRIVFTIPIICILFMILWGIYNYAYRSYRARTRRALESINYNQPYDPGPWEGKSLSIKVENSEKFDEVIYNPFFSRFTFVAGLKEGRVVTFFGYSPGLRIIHVAGKNHKFKYPFSKVPAIDYARAVPQDAITSEDRDALKFIFEHYDPSNCSAPVGVGLFSDLI